MHTRAGAPAWALVLALLALAAPAVAAEGGSPRVTSWACYYGSKPAKALSRFDLVVLESAHMPPPARRGGKPLALGYASLGEVSEDGPYWALAQGKPFVLDRNPNFKSRFVDLRDPGWKALVLERIVPDVLGRGYDGLFLDTLDSSVELERADPERFRGMTEAAVALVEDIKKRFPTARLCLNRALPVLAACPDRLDFALLECLYSDFDFAAKRYRLVDPKDREEMLAMAKQARLANPSLTLLSLDYADPKDPKAVRQALSFSRKHKLVPYVATPELDAVFTFSLAR